MPEIIRGLITPDAPQTAHAYGAFNVADSTELSVAVLGSLGLVDDRSAAAEHIGQHMQALHDRLQSGGLGTEIEPYFAIELSERFTLGSLLKAFDAKAKHPTYVFEDLWNQYTPAELNSRRIGQKAVGAAGEGITGSARAMLLGGDRSDAPGLYYTDKNLKQQIKAVGDHELVNPADYVMINAQRREAGAEMLDVPTFTRFVGLEKKSARGTSWVPGAYWRVGRLELHRSYGFVYPYVGVRLSVGPEA